MAFWAEPGSSPTETLGLFTSSSGTVTSDGSVTILGQRTILGDSGGGAGVAAYVQRNGVLGANGRLTFRLKFSALPSADCGILDTLSSANGFQFRIFLRSTGVLRLVGNSTTLATGSTVLSVNTEYRLTLCWTIASTSVNESRIYIDDAASPECTASNATLPAASSDRFRCGWTQTNVGGSNKLINVAQFYMDDGSTLDNTGDVRVTAKLPAAAHTQDVAWTTFGTGAINERPINQANRRILTGAGDTGLELYHVQARSVGDVDLTGATVVGFYGWVQAGRSSGGYVGTDRLVSSGVSTTVALTTSGTAYQETPQTTSTYPTTIGMQRTVADTPDALFYEAGVVVVYTPGSGALFPPIRTYQQAVNRASTY
jgi:hypothetical protein